MRTILPSSTSPILCAMSSHASDPYARQRTLWSRWRCYARWVIWWFEVATFFGLLKRQGLWSRCLARELGRLEHGLRCLLIIGAQRLTPPQPSPSRGGRFNPDCGDGCDDSLPLVGRVGVGGFSFSLNAFKTPQNTDTTISERPQKATRPADASPELDLTTRLDAVLDVFENSSTFTAEMARRLAQRGIKLKRPLTQRPSGAERPKWCDEILSGPFGAIPHLDSS